MLPELALKREQTFTGGSNGRINADKNEQPLKNINAKLSNKKVRTGGGFNKSTPQENMPKQIPSVNQTQRQNLIKFARLRKGQDLATEIKLIQRKIKFCQRKLEHEKKEKQRLAEEQTREGEKEYDFERVVQRELELQGYHTSQDDMKKNFDYLTNPGGKPVEDEEQQPVEESQPIFIQKKVYNIDEGLQKLQRHHEQSLKKKFQRRQMFPHQACKRKTPKLAITSKNAMNKYGKVESQAEHQFRVLTKEVTPQEIYPTIPNFAVVKDNLSRNIVAYLGDYKPFLQKTKEGENIKIEEGEIDEENDTQVHMIQA